MSLHDGLQNNHHDLNNVHQNELERNSLDVDNPTASGKWLTLEIMCRHRCPSTLMYRWRLE
jgi:hypothetical protein